MKSALFRFILLFILVGGGASIVYGVFYYEPALPVYNPSDVNHKLVDKSVRNVMRDHKIGDFCLTDQNNQTVTPLDFKDKIYIANFMFTTCENICPAMTGNVKKVYKAYLEDPEIKLLSHSVIPEIDTVPVLKAYTKKFDVVNKNKWHFTTGPRKHIYELARMHYFAATDSGDGGPSDFVHTENVMLIDKESRIRGYYDGTSFDEIDQLIEDIDRLKEEYE